MLYQRLIVCLDVAGGRVVKGVGFGSLRDIGDPVALATRYEREGADEIVYLDINASAEGRETLVDLIRRTAEELFIPLTVGGGVRTVEDIRRNLMAGADKVSLNSAAVARPELLTEAADRFGAQCVVASIDVRREGDAWRVYTHGGRNSTGLDALEWATECAARGAGEILLTSIDRDGTRRGYDIELTRAVAACVSVPVVASGGAGSEDDVVQVLREGHADAALVAGLLHDGVTTVGALKQRMAEQNVRVRAVA
ncbi:MAG TPA: imidazole glycerol phosphate synthase subunit HisF [Gemmatimonadaceae bacterium]